MRRQWRPGIWRDTVKGARAALMAAILLGLGLLAGSLIHGRAPVDGPPLSLKVCASDERAALGIAATDQPSLQWVDERCYLRVFRELNLRDFSLRRAEFEEQHYAERIILWMVVLITSSGVGLAGIQLYTTYRLAERTKQPVGLEVGQTEVTLSQNSIVIRSAVTGIIILALSFAFFYVYVFQVYTIKHIDEMPLITGTAATLGAARPLSTSALAGPPPGRALAGEGGLGSPPKP